MILLVVAGDARGGGVRRRPGQPDHGRSVAGRAHRYLGTNARYQS